MAQKVIWMFQPNTEQDYAGNRDQYTVFALTYDHEFEGGNQGGGFEIGLMLFTPPFFKL